MHIYIYIYFNFIKIKCNASVNYNILITILNYNLSTVVIALVVPHVDAVVSLIGAVCSNALALLLPALSDVCLRSGSKPILQKNWFRTTMNIMAVLLSFVGVTAGSYVSIKNMIELTIQDFQNTS